MIKVVSLLTKTMSPGILSVSSRLYSAYVDLYPNPMPYTSELFKKRFPNRLQNLWEVSHDEPCVDPLPSLQERLAAELLHHRRSMVVRSFAFGNAFQAGTMGAMQKERISAYVKIIMQFIECLRIMLLNYCYRFFKINFETLADIRCAEGTLVKLDLEEVSRDWLHENALDDIRIILDHYGIFKDLFKYGFFYPVTPMEIDYKGFSIFYGNRLDPGKATEKPTVRLFGDPTKLYTLIFLDIDGDLCREEGETLLWMLSDIKNNSVDEAVEVIPYVQPFPFQGTGFHRCTFVLFQHERPLDVSDLKSDSFSSPESRSFNMFDFYCKHQDVLTPVSLLFFQSQWDQTVTAVFHQYFQIKEPIYEYNFEKKYLPKQVKYPDNQPFNKYLDAYRDRRDLNESVIKKYIKETCPFTGYPKQLKYPHAEEFEDWMPTWYRNELTEYRSRLRRWARVPY